jgi:predicted nucleotidyltransferase
MTQKIIDFLRTFQADHPEIEKLFLFGSRVRGDATPTSDIDVGVQIDTERLESVWDYFDLLEELRASVRQRFGLHCDVYDLAAKSFDPPEAIDVQTAI